MTDPALTHPTESAPAFTVIIPAYNEERFIASCLAAVREQNLPPDRFEVIVVDNGSTDRTIQLAREAGAAVLRHPGLRVGALRNRGAEAARGTFLAFLDADCVPGPEWLRIAEESLRSERCVMGGSYALPADPHWIERAWQAQERAGRRRTRLLPAGDLLLRRDDFLRLGGFREELPAGEDAEFCLRASASLPVITDDRLSVVHLGNPKSLRKFARRETWHGMGALGSLDKDWMDKPLLATIAFAGLSLAQVTGLALAALGFPPLLLLGSTMGIFVLLVATVAYRLAGTNGWREAPSLLLLYYLYYSARTASLFRLMARREFHRGKK